MAVIHGRVPGWALRGSGDGSGYGYGDGDGDGSGDGSGYGDGDGSGDGSGYGDGDGSGDGSGYGEDLERCIPLAATVTADHLKGACSDQVRLFKRCFPNGGTWPDDIAKAAEYGLDVSWPIKNLGLLPLISE